MNFQIQNLKITGNSILLIIAYVLLILWILKLQECSPSPQTAAIKGKDSISYKIDTVKITSIAIKPVYSVITKHDTFFNYLPNYKIDTAAILRNYVTPYLYTQTFISPDYRAHFSGVISYDSLYNAKIDVQVLRPIEITNNTTVTNPVRNMVFVGCGIGGDINSFNLGPTLALLTKKQHLYALSSNVAMSEPNVLFSMYFKVHL